MNKKGLFFNEIIKAIGKKEEEHYLKETKRIQRKIDCNNLKPPKSLDKKIYRIISNENKKEKKKKFVPKIAVFLLIFIIGCQTIYITNPKIAMAVRYSISKLFFYQSEKSLDIHKESRDFFEGYKFDIPDEFALLQPDPSPDIEKQSYKNESGQYIQFSVYPDHFLFSFDIEKCDSMEDINVKEYSAKYITKNGVTTILVFIDDDKLLEVKSSLPANEIKEIVESIHTNE